MKRPKPPPRAAVGSTASTAPSVRFDGVAFVERHGVVLASARGAVPSLAEAVAGEPIRGSWWSHAKGRDIFRVLGDVADSPDVLAFRLVDGKLTLVHRRVWPALVKLADALGTSRLAAVVQEHTASGAHRNVTTPYPRWVSAETRRAADALSLDDARALLGPALAAPRRRQRGARATRA